MSLRNAASQQFHDQMVCQLFNELDRKGYERISPAHGKCSAEGEAEKVYSEKAEMFFSPDIYAEKDGVAYYFEVETEDSLLSAVTRVEIECFLARAKSVGGYFYLVVPEGAREKAAGLLRGIEEKNVHKAFILTV
jgi:hypothetical protein